MKAKEAVGERGLVDAQHPGDLREEAAQVDARRQVLEVLPFDGGEVKAPNLAFSTPVVIGGTGLLVWDLDDAE